MKESEMEVKVKGKVVSKIKVPQFDSLAEAVKALGEKTVLEYVNAQNRAKLRNAEASRVTGGPKKSKGLANKLWERAKEDPAKRDKITQLMKELGFEIPA